MNKKKIEKLFFSGLPISLPLGLLMAFAYSRLSLVLKELFGQQYNAKLEAADYKVMFLIVAGVVAMIFAANVKRKVIDKEDEFNPLKKKT